MATAKVPIYLGLLEIEVRLRLSSSASNMLIVLGVEGWQCSSQRSAMKSPVHCGNPKDDRQTIDTCIPVVYALFFSLIDIHSGGISSFSIIIAFFFFSIYCQTLFRILSAGVLCTLRVVR